MKWILIVLGSLFGLLILGAAVLLAMGTRADSNRITTSLVIHQKPEAIWPWLYESEKVKQWVTWLVEIHEEGHGEPTPGGKAVWVMEDRNNGNHRVEITGVVQSVERARRLQITMTAPEGFHGDNVYTLVPQPDGSTRLDTDSRFVFDSSLARLMTPLIRWQAKKKLVDDQNHLRALLEAAR
jgi:uncharacterized protein YndB with AHSA1/START domain